MSRKEIIIYMCSICTIVIIAILLMNNSKETYSTSDTTNSCSKEAVLQLAKIIYKEVGSDSAIEPTENFYMRIITGSIAINNANTKNGNNWYEKIYNLTDNNYQGYSTYKDKSFESVVRANQGQILYISELILTGKYNLPTNMNLEAEKSIVERYGTVWDVVYTHSGFYDIYFGHEKALNNVDVFGKEIKDTSNTYFRNLAKQIELNDYSSYTESTVCTHSESEIVKSKYTINFYMNDGSDKIYKTIEIEEEQTLKLPENPTREGYSFKNWQYENGESFDSSKKITSNTNLYANWEEIKQNEEPPSSSSSSKPSSSSPKPSNPSPSQSSNKTNNNVETNANTGSRDIMTVIILGIISIIATIYYRQKQNNI